MDEKGEDVGPGEIGEIIVQAKQIMAEYWHKPDDTEKTIIVAGCIPAIWGIMMRKAICISPTEKKI